MSIDLSAENGPMFLEFEIAGPLTTDDLSKVVDSLDDDQAIQKFSIEIGTENPAVLELPTLNSKVTTNSGDSGNGDQTSQPVQVPAEHLATEENCREQVHPENVSSGHTPRLQTDSDPFAIMRLISHHEGWLRTKEIAETIPPDWDVSEDALGSNLWNLDNRGLVEKRPYEDDNRQNEYRITDVGEQVLNETVERAVNLLPIT